MKISKWIWGLMIISIVGTLLVYTKLPPEIPTHWNIQGEADDYGDKITVFFLAGLPFLLAALFIFLPKIDPKKESYQKHKKAYEVFINVLLVFFVLLHWVAVVAALGYSVNVGKIIGTAVGILLIVIGNYMGQIRHNYFFGIKTPWTLASEKVWVKTHRVGGWLFIIMGILFLLGGVLGNPIIIKFSVFFMIASILFLYAYSFFEFKKTEN